MEKLKKYQTQIFNVITIFLILQFAIFPGLTAANTILNILAGIGLLLLVVWGGLALYEYTRSSEGLVDVQELKEAEHMVKEKPKTKRKPKVSKPEYPLPPHHTTVRTPKVKQKK
jgi:hypothetical protein